MWREATEGLAAFFVNASTWAGTVLAWVGAFLLLIFLLSSVVFGSLWEQLFDTHMLDEEIHEQKTETA